MKDKYLSTVTETRETVSADGVELIIRAGVGSGYREGRNMWIARRKDNDTYIDSVDDSIGEFYSSLYKELENLDEYIEKMRGTYVNQEYWSLGTKNQYIFRGYTIETKKEFDKAIGEMEYLCEHEGVLCGYNDEHGVGDILYNKESGTYTMHHHRYGTTRTQESQTRQQVADFLRDFHDIGTTKVYTF